MKISRGFGVDLASVRLFQVVARTERCSRICKNVQGRMEKQMPSQNLVKSELKPSLKLSFRIQDTSSAWDTFWLLYTRPTVLPGLVLCEVDLTTAHTTCVLSTPYSVLSWYLLSEGFLHLSPLPTLCLCATQSGPKSTDLIKYSYWTEYFSWLCYSVDPNIP